MKKHFLSITLFAILLATFSACDQNMEEMKVTNTGTPVVSTEQAVAKSPVAQVTVSPCGYGYIISAQWSPGVPYGDPISYVIKTTSNITVDSGTIANGATTPWVLSPCTLYKITVTLYPLQQHTFTVMSDGCNNLFYC